MVVVCTELILRVKCTRKFARGHYSCILRSRHSRHSIGLISHASNTAQRVRLSHDSYVNFCRASNLLWEGQWDSGTMEYDTRDMSRMSLVNPGTVGWEGQWDSGTVE